MWAYLLILSSNCTTLWVSWTLGTVNRRPAHNLNTIQHRSLLCQSEHFCKSSLSSIQAHEKVEWLWQCDDNKEGFKKGARGLKHTHGLQKHFELHARGAWQNVIELRHKRGQRQRAGAAATYAGARLHGVSQITHKSVGLVSWTVAARQLSQTLERRRRDREVLSRHALRHLTVRVAWNTLFTTSHSRFLFTFSALLCLLFASFEKHEVQEV